MVKLIIRVNGLRGWVQVPEPPENHLDYIRKYLVKWMGEGNYAIDRTVKFTYKATPVHFPENNGAVNTVVRLFMEDYNQ